ncbi:bifunctional DNA-binding transcriptional regulator/O6-methylguanine-DNA methyltransferase Ada [Parasphingopyxis sp. GrpM-11]|uniref:methylated-DNA--[protein]-cysteine S-methyltransferase n=2 Tax=Parasphingopyxis marina TaxID=2761622 RepID=A0A842I0S9_9SPHN|nr:bifunctional DNA-binding transcriptional regulator/O6-methylguanine-DNA methyltransferase Ada [Parasphingopyxis marina]MBC2777364.1 bifunctional DNA-binding transcriptional regulator/O6-methylguanine-DNA methyltransferase Ada [Parasphingopyxis marina]
MPDADTAWRAVKARDRGFDGRFVTGVLTTGIYCRPSCAARHPRRENVRFFASGAEAREAGLRACKRCMPDNVSRDEAAVAEAVTLIERAEETPKLDAIAEAVGYSATHFLRVFKRAMGVTPAAYARRLRGERAEKALMREERVTDAIYEAGYSGPGRFYAETGKRLGMTPSAWRRGGKGVTIRWAVAQTSLGEMLVAATDKGICRLSFDEGEEALHKRFPHAEIVRANGEMAELVKKTVAAVDNPARQHNLPLDVHGTAFQEAVWRELTRIPPGETRSYAQIAAAVGKPKAVRAAGSANGANNVAVLIPCHRVIRTDGSLGGYAYGLEIKKKLLEKESAAR